MEYHTLKQETELKKSNEWLKAWICIDCGRIFSDLIIKTIIYEPLLIARENTYIIINPHPPNLEGRWC